MFTRVVSFTGARDIDAGVRYITETAAPLLRQQNGFRGMTTSVDRAAGVIGVLSLWDTDADRDASESAMLKAREEAVELTGSKVRIEHFEEDVVEMVGQPRVGASLLIRWLRMDPAKIDENLAFFRSEVLPQIKAEPGLLAVRHMFNRETGDAIVGTVWTDESSMEAAAQAALKRQPAAEGRVTFGEQSKREIVFIDMPQL